MKRVLSLSFRPQSFDEMVGVKDLVAKIRTQMTARIPAAWMFIGESGSGKTTIARILALSLQCPHQPEFGFPCQECQKGTSKFDIVEINASEHSGVDETEQVIAGAYYQPKPPSRYRVYIFDEAQKLSDASQNALLKYFEDSPTSTVWIVCTTEPDKIKRTLRRRCVTHTLPALSLKGTQVLVTRAIKFAGGAKPAEPLVEALLEAGVTSPGFVVAAVEKYLSGDPPEKAALVGIDSTIDTLRICRAIVNDGDWETVRKELVSATPNDARAVRAAVAGYMKSILLDSEVSKKARFASDGIQALGRLTFVEDGMQVAGTAAALYTLCQHFRTGK